MKKNSQAFINQLLACLLVTLCFGGSAGLGAVWMRHQISVTANTNRALSAQLVELERRIAEAETRVDVERQPEALRQRNEAWRLGLVPPEARPPILVAENPVRRLIERSHRELFGEPAGGLHLPLAHTQ